MFHVEREKRRIEVLARGLTRIGSRLLVCRSLAHGHCYLPGGHVEFGESAEEALRREYSEETGLDVLVGPLATAVEQRFVQGTKERHELSLVFHVELRSPASSGGEVVLAREPDIAFEWIPVFKLETERFVPACLIPHLAAGPMPPWLSADVRIQ